MASLASGAGGPASSLNDPNLQVRKEDFLGDVEDRSIYNPHRLETPVSPYQVMAGTVIPATLLTGVNSDLPGQAGLCRLRVDTQIPLRGPFCRERRQAK